MVNFHTDLWGLSLRHKLSCSGGCGYQGFSLPFWRAFIEASWLMSGLPLAVVPFLRFLAETFIEAAECGGNERLRSRISLPFRRDFH